NPSGGSTQYTVTLTALGGVAFPSSVTPTCPTTGNNPLPAGWSCGFVPTSVTPTGAGANTTLTLTTTNTPAGPVNFTVQATSGAVTSSQVVQVTNGLDFTLPAWATPVTVQLGPTTSTTISATTVGGFVSPIPLSCLAASPAPASGSLTCSNITNNP